MKKLRPFFIINFLFWGFVLKTQGQYYLIPASAPCPTVPLFISTGSSSPITSNIWNISWTFNGNPIAGTTSQNNCLSNGSGLYQATFCIGSSSTNCTIYSAQSNIAVIQPAILNISGSQYFILGQGVSFNATLSTSQSGPVNWYINGQNQNSQGLSFTTTSLTNGAVVSATYVPVCGSSVNSTNTITVLTIPSLWNINGSDVYNNNTGRVGIGTSTPNAKLQIVGSGGYNKDLTVNGFMQSGDSPTSGGLYIGNDNRAYVGKPAANSIGFWVDGTWKFYVDALGNASISEPPRSDVKFYVKGFGFNQNTWYGRVVAAGPNKAVMMGEYNSQAWLGAQNADLATWTDLLIQPVGGNVGIGTLAPSDKLQVNPNGAGGITIGTNSGSGGYTNLTLGVSAQSGGYSYLQSIKNAGSSYGDLILNNNGGNAGIGTSSPSERLEVAGNIKANILKLGSGNEVFFADNGQIRSLDNNHRILFRRSENKMELREAGDIIFSPGATAGNETAKISFMADGRVVIKNRIDAPEFRACLSPGSCPDYVFDKNYDLLPLTEVEKYIQANKHLPDVPSAKEMEGNGMDIKAMNLLLLKKVEELTLHIIQLEKRMKKVEEPE